MKQYWKKLTAFFISALLIPGATALAESPQEKGLRIATEIDALPQTEKMTSEAIFRIYDAQDKLVFTKKSRAASLTRNFNDPANRLSRSISYFFAPADDKGNAALMIEQPGDQDDDQWVYLKGLRKPKRIIGSDKSSSFMGSDFSNGDVASRDINDFDYVWLATEEIGFKDKKIKTEKIESEFKEQKKKEDYGYSKMIAWVHPQTGLIFRGDSYDLNGQLFKRATLLSFAVKKNKAGKKVFIPTGMEMKNLLKGTRTVMITKNIKVGKKTKNIKESMFNTSYLTRKWW